jgi:hypothetical protein
VIYQVDYNNRFLKIFLTLHSLPTGGCDATLKAAAETDLLKTLEDAAPQFDYDILVKAVFILIFAVELELTTTYLPRPPF